MFLKTAKLLPVLLLAACSTDPIAPALTSFATAAQTAVGSHLKLIETPQHKSNVRAARLRALAHAEAAYEGIAASDCLYIQPAVRINPASFEDSCKPKLVDANGKTVATFFDPPTVQAQADRVIDARPGDVEVMRKHEGIELAKSLKTYAETLEMLSSSSAPEDVSTGFSSAISAIEGLFGTVSSVAIRQGQSAPTPPNFARFSSITSVLVREVLEARRYMLLKKIVTQADPSVRQASRQLAILTYQAEHAKLQPTVTELRNASTSFDAQSIAGIDRTEKALAALRDADKKAAFRQFDRLQQTHAAILASFDAPRSADDLTAANARINDFLDAVKSN